MAGVAKKHFVDGRWTTVDEVAAELGLTRQQVYNQMHHKQCGLQTVANLVRSNQALNGQGKAALWLVDGKWMTVRQAAETLGINYYTLRNWIYRHRHPDGTPALLSEAIAAFREKKIIHGGSAPKLHRVGGKQMTTIEAAEMLGIDVLALRLHMSRHKASLASTIRYYEKRKMKKAEKDILAILMGR